MPKHYGVFDPLDPLPAHFPTALQEFLSSLGLGGVQLRIKPGASNTLQVPAGSGDAQVGLTIGGRWRYATANVEIAGSGSARAVDVYATAHNNAYSSGTVTVGPDTFPVEVDGTDYSFALAIVDANASPPSGVDASRKIGVATWDGAKFTTVVAVIGGAALTTPAPSGFAQVATSQSTSSTSAVDLTTAGPSVTVDVPANGRVAIGAQVDLTDDGIVYLAENGGTAIQVINAGAGTWYIAQERPPADGPGSENLIGTSNRFGAGELVFPVASAGTYTYKLMYGVPLGSCAFSNRKLWARVLT